jgi:hypothetical protein
MYSEAVDDEKLRLLAFEDRWHFVALLCLKAQGILDERNADLRTRKICVKLGLDSVELETVMKRLVTVGLVTSTGQPAAWSKRQFQSDSSSSRVRAFRERQRNVSVTPPDTDTDTDTDTERREERAKRASRLPDDFGLTDERRKVATTESLDAERTFSKFCDFWRAASGQRARKHDWDAAWRYWCRNDRSSTQSQEILRNATES